MSAEKSPHPYQYQNGGGEKLGIHRGVGNSDYESESRLAADAVLGACVSVPE